MWVELRHRLWPVPFIEVGTWSYRWGPSPPHLDDRMRIPRAKKSGKVRVLAARKMRAGASSRGVARSRPREVSGIRRGRRVYASSSMAKKASRNRSRVRPGGHGRALRPHRCRGIRQDRDRHGPVPAEPRTSRSIPGRTIGCSSRWARSSCCHHNVLLCWTVLPALVWSVTYRRRQPQHGAG